VERRQLGDSEIRLSPLGLGTVEIGMPYGIGKPAPPPDEECIALLHRAVERGINYIDTAPGYGRSEEVVGKAFADFCDRPLIATKINLRPPESPEPPTGDRLRACVEESVQQSLKHLCIDSLDLLQLHNALDEDLTPELIGIMVELQKRGVVKHLGATTYGEDAPSRVLELADHFRILQVAYNVLDRRLEEGIFPRAKGASVGLVVRSVFLQGALSDRVLPDHVAKLRDAVTRVREIGVQAGMSLTALALRYVAFNPDTYITLFGTTSFDELDANIAAYEQGPLPGDVLEALNSIEQLDEYYLNAGEWNP
jgi:aryl-alcohol dehydrogenase-like predicted oxidoreductase